MKDFRFWISVGSRRVIRRELMGMSSPAWWRRMSRSPFCWPEADAFRIEYTPFVR